MLMQFDLYGANGRRVVIAKSAIVAAEECVRSLHQPLPSQPKRRTDGLGKEQAEKQPVEAYRYVTIYTVSGAQFDVADPDRTILTRIARFAASNL